MALKQKNPNNNLDQNNPANPNKSPFSHPQDTRMFFGGVGTDTTRELLGVEKEGGKYIDATNMRVDDFTSGNIGGGIGKGIKRIKGEELYYVNNNATEYTCIGAFNVGDTIVECWAKGTQASPSTGGIITINGNVMVNSLNLTWTPNNLLQWDTNDTSLGQEFYVTDNNIPPCYFSIADIITNWNNGVPTTKYFAGFNLNNYIVNLLFPTDNIVFNNPAIAIIGSGGGLPVGQYAYAFSYVDDAGNQTNWSVQTPLIYVPQNLDTINSNSPYTNLKTIGANPDPNVATSYGVSMSFRVNNANNYQYVQIMRIPYNGGQAIGYSPTPLIVKTIPIQPGIIQIINYVDCVNNQNQDISNATLSSYELLSQIARSKAIRYFYNKILLGNITYLERDIADKVTFIKSANNNSAIPILQNITKQGYKNPYNHAYYRGYMHGEQYGYYLVAWDSNYSRSLAVEIDNNGVLGVQMPNKRDPMSTYFGGDSETYSPNYSWQASTRGIVEKTFEVVDYKLGTTRPNNGGGSQQMGNEDVDNTHGCNILASEGGATRKGNNVTPNNVGYRPFYPQTPSDNNQSNIFYTPIDSVAGAANTNHSLTGINYDPTIFNPEVNALGLAFLGLQSWPDWVSAFSVVRTEKAGRVVAQGMGFWQMFDAQIWDNNGRKGTGTKSQSALAVHFPDIENGVVASAIVDDMINNPGNYQLQLVEPLGFTGEMFHGRSNVISNPVIFAGADGVLHSDSQIDIAIHAKCQCEISNDDGVNSQLPSGSSPRVNQGEDPNQVGIQDTTGTPDSWYVGFGVWRNQGQQPTIGGQPFRQNGNFAFDIKSVQTFFGPGDFSGGTKSQNSEGVQNYVFNLADPATGNDINLYTASGGNTDWGHVFVDNNTRFFQEPVYIINIVRKGTSIKDLNFTSLLPTGNFVKISAVIGIYNGSTNTFVLCGERTVDCGKLPTDTLDRYIWIQPSGDINQFRWINVSYLSGASIAIIESDITNGTTNYNGLRLYGLYTCDETTNFNVVFSNPSFLPADGSSVIVKYDNRFPVYVFGGDTFVGQSCFPLVHRDNKSTGGNGDDKGFGSFFRWNRGMPYSWWNFKNNYYIVRDTPASGLPQIQEGEGIAGNQHPELYGVNSICIGAIRQMIILYYCQSYTHLPLGYEACYPVVNYVMRPQSWNPDFPMSGDWNVTNNKSNMLFNQYTADYPDEIKRWTLGGFRINMFNNPLTLNLDYSKENVDDLYDFVGQEFYSKNVYFPDRVTWSNTRPIETTLAPSLKTFIPTNVFDIDDNRGQIQRLHSFRHKLYGENAYALCELDFCTLICNKSLITSATGNFLAASQPAFGSAFIQEQVWVNETKKAGLPDNWWLTFIDNGQEAFYANYNGVFSMSEKGYGTTIESITEGYYYQLYKSLCQRVQRGSGSLIQQLGAMYNTKQKEYWVYFKTTIPTTNITNGGQNLLTLSQGSSGTSTPHAAVNKTVAGSFIRFFIPNLNRYNQVLYKVTDTTGQGVDFKDNNGNVIVNVKNNQWCIITYNPYSVSNNWTFRIVDQDLNEYKDSFVFAYCNDDKGGASQASKKWLGVFDYQFDKLISFNGQIYGSRYDNGALRTYTLDTGYQINGSPIKGVVYQVFNPQIQQSYIFSRFRINSNRTPDNLMIYRPNDLSISLGSVTAAQMKNYDAFENLLTRFNDNDDKPQGTNLVVQIQSVVPDEEFFLNSISFEYNKVR